MFQGLGSVVLGDYKFQNKVMDSCIDSFELSETLENHTYDYLSAGDQYLKPAKQSIRPKKRKWSLTLSYPKHNHSFYYLLENDPLIPVGTFTPSLTFTIIGPDGLVNKVAPGSIVRAYNITKKRQEVPSGITFPGADPTDLLYVAVDDLTQAESRSLKGGVTVGLQFSFIGNLFIDKSIYRIVIEKMEPKSIITIDTGSTPSVNYEIIGGFTINELIL